jgi:hypothetical protein
VASHTDAAAAARRFRQNANAHAPGLGPIRLRATVAVIFTNGQGLPAITGKGGVTGSFGFGRCMTPGAREHHEWIAVTAFLAKAARIERRSEHANKGAETSRAERHYIYKTAKVSFPSGGIVEVMVKDLSARGVSIEFRGATLPEKVLIMGPGLKLNRWAEVVWQRAGHAGLKFVADEGLRGPQSANVQAAEKAAAARPRIRKPKAFG